MHVELQCVATNGGGRKDLNKFYEKYLEKGPMVLIGDLRGNVREGNNVCRNIMEEKERLKS